MVGCGSAALFRLWVSGGSEAQLVVMQIRTSEPSSPLQLACCSLAHISFAEFNFCRVFFSPLLVPVLFRGAGFPRPAGDSCQIRPRRRAHQNPPGVSRDLLAAALFLFLRWRQILSRTNRLDAHFKRQQKLFVVPVFLPPFTHQKQKLSRNCTVCTQLSALAAAASRRLPE